MKSGTWLLKIAPLVFNERFIETVVRPPIADLQSEVAAAGANHAKRLREIVARLVADNFRRPTGQIMAVE